MAASYEHEYLIEALRNRISDLEYLLELANRELDRLAPYANIPAPPLNEAQRAIIREHLKLDPIQWVNENADDASLPSMRLR